MQTQIPKGLWAAIIYEMKKYKTFREGYRQGLRSGMDSQFLTIESDSSYRHKFGVLIACFEQGLIDDIILERNTLSVFAFRKNHMVYRFTEGVRKNDTRKSIV